MESSPPVFEHLLFEQPWPLLVALIVVAAVLQVVGRRERRKSMHVAALGMLVAAGGVYLLSWAVVTDREQLADHVRTLLQATEEPLNLRAFDALIAPTAMLTGPDGDSWLSFDEVRDRLRTTNRQFGIKEHVVRGLGVEVADTGIGSTLIDLRTYTQKETGLPIRSVWRLHWKRTAHGHWQVTQIQWMEFQGQPPRFGTLRW